jgi:hypothetical protein
LGKYEGCNKIIFCCNDASNLEAMKNFCKVVTLQPPSFDEVLGCTTFWPVLCVWCFSLVLLDSLMKDDLLLPR